VKLGGVDGFRFLFRSLGPVERPIMAFLTHLIGGGNSAAALFPLVCPVAPNGSLACGVVGLLAVPKHSWPEQAGSLFDGKS
jgi:hypothetical protein